MLLKVKMLQNFHARGWLYIKILILELENCALMSLVWPTLAISVSNKYGKIIAQLTRLKLLLNYSLLRATVVIFFKFDLQNYFWFIIWLHKTQRTLNELMTNDSEEQDIRHYLSLFSWMPINVRVFKVQPITTLQRIPI